MLVDDVETDNYLNEQVLKEAGVEHVYTCKTGESAMDFLENIYKNYSVLHHCMPKIVFLDLNMPMMDGFQLLNAFEKFNTEFKDEIKFVILTSSQEMKDRIEAKKHNRIIGYLNKPLTSEDVNYLLRNLKNNQVR